MTNSTRVLRFVARAAAALLLAGLAVSVSACTSPSAPSVPVTFTMTDLRVGTGATATTGATVRVNYTGWLYDGTDADKKGEQFDSNLSFVFWLGTGQVIAGWDQGIVGMKVGGLRRLIVPASLAYGRSGAGNSIPPNASLVFDIELLGLF